MFDNEALMNVLWMVTTDYRRITLAVFIFLMGIVISSLVGRYCHAALDRLVPTWPSGARVLVDRIARWGIIGISSLWALNMLGVQLSALLTSGTVVLVGLGLAVQQITQSFVAGLLLLAERELEPGDIIVLNGEDWRVTQINVRTTLLENHLDETLVIPNYQLASQSIRNRTHRNSRFRIVCQVGISYGSDIEIAIGALTEAANGVPGRDPDVAPVILLEQFGASSIDFSVRVAILDPWKAPELNSLLHRSVHRQLDAVHITIPFPQLDLHIPDTDRLPEMMKSAPMK